MAGPTATSPAATPVVPAGTHRTGATKLPPGPRACPGITPSFVTGVVRLHQFEGLWRQPHQALEGTGRAGGLPGEVGPDHRGAHRGADLADGALGQQRRVDHLEPLRHVLAEEAREPRFHLDQDGCGMVVLRLGLVGHRGAPSPNGKDDTSHSRMPQFGEALRCSCTAVGDGRFDITPGAASRPSVPRRVGCRPVRGWSKGEDHRQVADRLPPVLRSALCPIRARAPHHSRCLRRSALHAREGRACAATPQRLPKHCAGRRTR